MPTQQPRLASGSFPRIWRAPQPALGSTTVGGTLCQLWLQLYHIFPLDTAAQDSGRLRMTRIWGHGPTQVATDCARPESKSTHMNAPYEIVLLMDDDIRQ